MKQFSNLVIAVILMAGAAFAEEPAPAGATGSVCLAPVKDEGDPRGYFSEHFGVRIDKGPWVAVPADTPQLISDVMLDGRHLVSIRDGEKVIESFRFRFDRYRSRVLCLCTNPGTGPGRFGTRQRAG